MGNNIGTNRTLNESVKLRVLNDNQCEAIYAAALRVMKRTGCIIKHEEAVNILKENGATVTADGRVHIPAWLVEKALATAPKQLTFYNTEGEVQATLNARNGKTYWSPGISVQHVNDRHTGEKRLTTREDAFNTGLVCEAMPNFDFVTGMCFISDCHHMTADLHEIRALYESTTKVHNLWHSDRNTLLTTMEMYATIAGGMDKFNERPFAFGSATGTTPLGHPEEAIEKGMIMWKAGMPCLYGVTTMMGGTSPATIAGSLVLGLADSFVGLTLSQLVNPGTPVFIALGAVPFDMVCMSPSLTGPEAPLAAAAQADLFRYLNLPQLSLIGGSHCPIFDHQAANDMAQHILAGTLGGVGIGSFCGFLEDGMTSSLEALVYCNEAIDIARHFAKGVEVNEDTLAEDVIDSVGPLGQFLGEEHTMRYFKKNWMGKIMTHDNYDLWKANGAKDMQQRCVEKVDEIIAAGPTTNRDPKLLKELDDIIAAHEAKL